MQNFEINIIGNLLFWGSFAVHSSFENVINFVNEKNELISLSNDEKYLTTLFKKV